MTIPLLIAFGIGLVTPLLVRSAYRLIHSLKEDSVPMSKERQEMMLKEDGHQ